MKHLQKQLLPQEMKIDSFDVFYSNKGCCAYLPYIKVNLSLHLILITT